MCTFCYLIFIANNAFRLLTFRWGLVGRLQVDSALVNKSGVHCGWGLFSAHTCRYVHDFCIKSRWVLLATPYRFGSVKESGLQLRG